MAVIGIVGGSQVFAQASGGKVYAYNALIVTPQVVAPVNTGRVKITFHNPGTVDIFIAPLVVLNPATGANVPLVPTVSALGGCWRVFSNGGSLEISGECQGAWQAFAASGTGNSLTVMDSNVS
jgi:hypothetical protein